MGDLKPCPFNTPLKALDPRDIGSGKGSYPVIVADCKGEYVSGAIAHIRFEASLHSGTGRYMDYSLAKEMADYACEAINQYAHINKIKAEAVRDYQKYIDQRALSIGPVSVDDYIKNKLERGGL